MNQIEVKNLTKDYGSNRGVFDISLQVKEGEVMGILGANGAGKTTMIRHLLGFIHPKKGRLQIAGLDCFHEAKEIQRKLGYLPGEIAFIDNMTGMGFLKFMAGLKGISDFSRMNELIRLLDLKPKGKIKKMSKGMKQKIGLVCAFMGNPEILILDEPTSGLDPLMQNVFVNLILNEKKKGTTILMASHMFEEVEKTCDKVAMLQNGKLESIEDVGDLRKSRRKIYDVTFVDETVAQVFADSFSSVTKVDGKKVTIAVQGDVTEMIQKLAHHDIVNLEEKKQSLEELFLHYYGGEEHE